MAYARSKFGKIYYEITGTGETVVLIRGLGRWSEHWNDFDKRLAEKCRVITFDSRALGRSTAPLLPWHTITDLASDVALILRTERIEAAHIVGTSLGGMVALEFAANFPQMTKSVTVVNSSVGRSGHRRMTVEGSRLLISAPKLKDKIYPELAKILTSPATPAEAVEKLAREWFEVDRKYPMPTLVVGQQLVLALKWRNLPKVAAKIKCPVQIVSSDDDQFVPRGNSLFLAARIPGAVLTRLEKSGHEPHVDKPEELARAIFSFVK